MSQLVSALVTDSL